jgi:hypothetical protein
MKNVFFKITFILSVLSITACSNQQVNSNNYDYKDEISPNIFFTIDRYCDQRLAAEIYLGSPPNIRKDCNGIYLIDLENMFIYMKKPTYFSFDSEFVMFKLFRSPGKNEVYYRECSHPAVHEIYFNFNSKVHKTLFTYFPETIEEFRIYLKDGYRYCLQKNNKVFTMTIQPKDFNIYSFTEENLEFLEWEIELLEQAIDLTYYPDGF